MMDDTARSIRSVVEVMELFRAETAILHDKLPYLSQVRPHQADATASKSHQASVRSNRQVDPSNSRRKARPVTGFYPSPFGLLFYCKVDPQRSEHEVLDPETDDQQRIFRFHPSRLFRHLGGHKVEFRLAIRPGFDRINLDFSANQLFDPALVNALGFYKHKGLNWRFNKPDFSLLRRLLGEGKISANNRFRDKHTHWAEEETIFDVKCFNYRLIRFI